MGVADHERQAIRFVAEGAGAAALAALLKDQSEAPLPKDDAVAIILTGGNVDASLFATVLLGETPVV